MNNINIITIKIVTLPISHDLMRWCEQFIRTENVFRLCRFGCWCRPFVIFDWLLRCSVRGFPPKRCRRRRRRWTLSWDRLRDASECYCFVAAPIPIFLLQYLRWQPWTTFRNSLEGYACDNKRQNTASTTKSNYRHFLAVEPQRRFISMTHFDVILSPIVSPIRYWFSIARKISGILRCTRSTSHNYNVVHSVWICR